MFDLKLELNQTYCTIAVKPEGGFGLVVGGAGELPELPKKYAPASHPPVEGRGLMGVPGEEATSPPLPATSKTPALVPLHREPSAENVPQELVAFNPAPTVESELAVGAKSFEFVYPWEVAFAVV
jgi:hypothetical protein